MILNKKHTKYIGKILDKLGYLCYVDRDILIFGYGGLGK